MKLSKAAKIWIDYHKTHSKKKYGAILPGEGAFEMGNNREGDH
jgi:hypothetical protein